jgi:hypothetical protein
MERKEMGDGGGGGCLEVAHNVWFLSCFSRKFIVLQLRVGYRFSLDNLSPNKTHHEEIFLGFELVFLASIIENVVNDL